jgi:hypothetical protein
MIPLRKMGDIRNVKMESLKPVELDDFLQALKRVPYFTFYISYLLFVR